MRSGRGVSGCGEGSVLRKATSVEPSDSDRTRTPRPQPIPSWKAVEGSEPDSVPPSLPSTRLAAGAIEGAAAGLDDAADAGAAFAAGLSVPIVDAQGYCEIAGVALG